MRHEYLLNEGWKFHLGDIPYKEIRGHYPTYMHSKARNGLGAAAGSYFDADFTDVRLPHDYVLEGTADAKFNESAGSYDRPTAWYRRHFRLPCDIDGKRFILSFDGAGKNSTVWCNGCLAGENKSIYNNFYMDITPYLLDGTVNTISVKIENDEVEGWWYEGAGIYRDVWLIVTDEVSVDMWGTYVNPTLKEDGKWDVAIETTVWNNTQKYITANVAQTIYDADKNVVATVASDIKTFYSENILNQNVEVVNPKLWDIDDTNMYSMTTIITVDGEKVDEYETSFGFRTLRYDADTGFYLNGKSVKQRGLCYHLDHANQGVAVAHSLFEHRIQNIKKMGANAYRSAHNPTTPGMLDLCDKYGVMVMQENRWFNWSEKTQKEMIAMLKCSRNHPSVVIWSVGNEEPVQSTPTGGRLVEHLSKLLKLYDTTRPITVALNGGYFDSPSARASEVVGVNYNVHLYDQMRATHSTKPIIASETASSSGTRGVYFAEGGARMPYRNDYDQKPAVGNGSSCAGTIEGMEVNPFICGTYMWTGQDYRGEARWPGLIGAYGVTDACGFEKDKTQLVKALWTEEPMMHILPHWSHAGKEGQTIRVMTYTNAEQVELIVNGVSLGKKDYERYNPLNWEVVYEPGYIEAIGYKNGEVVCKDKKVTTSEPVKLVIESQLDTITNTGEDVAMFKLYLVDKDGNFIPTADQKIIPSVLDADCGEILSVSGGDPADHTHAKDLNQKMFNGLLQVLVRVKEGAKNVGIKATVDGTDMTTEFAIDVIDAPAIPKLEGGDRDLSIENFKIWPNCAGFEAVEETYNFDDMNSNEFITFDIYEPSKEQEYLLFTARAVYPETDLDMSMVFEGIKGEYEMKIYHDEQTWPNPEPKEFITMREHKVFDEKQDYEVVLDGFGSYERMKIILVCKNNGNFSMDNVKFKLIK